MRRVVYYKIVTVGTSYFEKLTSCAMLRGARVRRSQNVLARLHGSHLWLGVRGISDVNYASTSGHDAMGKSQGNTDEGSTRMRAQSRTKRANRRKYMFEGDQREPALHASD